MWVTDETASGTRESVVLSVLDLENNTKWRGANMNRIRRFRIRIRNWRMERIPEIERPACIHCRRDMYWHRGKQDWACKPCDDYHFNINAPWNDEDWDDEDYWDDDEYYDDDLDLIGLRS